jgi:hypothetical protein
MATKTTRWEGRHERAKTKPKKTFRALTAASSEIEVGNKVEAQRQRMLRQNWQLIAWTMFDSIPELSYAEGFLSHCAARMRIFPGAYPLTGETDNPIAIDDPLLDAPDQVIEACTNAMADLGNGRLAIANIMEQLSLNFSVTGEAFLLGLTDPETLQNVYSIRSVSEIVIYDDDVKLREGPMTNTGVLGFVDLPEDALVERMWQPHPQFRLLAQSPMRALINICEDLTIMRRLIRATGRSRLAGRGILFLPSEMAVPNLNDDNGNIDSDEFLSTLTTAMMTPIAREGDASGVVPLVVQAPGEQIDHVKWIEFASTFDEQAGKIREELTNIIATGLDLPQEIFSLSDLNHWSAFQVDSNTFRYHIEPHVIKLVEALTGAFLRPYFATCGLDKSIVDEWMTRIIFWYDPTELVTPPDLSTSAITAYNAKVISAAALRKYLGFKDSDAPSAEEIEIRLISDTRTWPVNALIALLHQLDPELTFPAIPGPGIIPGLKGGPGGGVDVPLETPALPAGPTDTTTTQATTVVPEPTTATVTNPLPGNENGSLLSSGYIDDEHRLMVIRVVKMELARRGIDVFSQPMLQLTASVVDRSGPSDRELQLSRKLTQIDADLRARLQVAANAEMRTQLKKAAHRIRQSVSKDKDLKAKIATTRNEFVALRLSGDIDPIVAASYVTNDWASLEEQFKSWTGLAQRQAIAAAQQIAGDDELGSSANAVIAMSEGVDKGWAVLRDALDEIAQHLAYNPDPNMTDDAALDALNPDTLVPTGVIRAAVGVAGGSPLEAFKQVLLDTGATVPAVPQTQFVGGIGTGATISNLLTSAGASTASFTWVHGPSEKPFSLVKGVVGGHLALDGQEFDSFTDPLLANNGDWPDNQFFLPGDHAGCICDAQANWAMPQNQ